MFDSIQFTAPLPIAALIIPIVGALYTLIAFKKVIKQLNLVKGNAINQAYKNYFLEGNLHLPSYASIDPSKEMEQMSKSWVVKLYSRKYANLIYARISECIERHQYLLNSTLIDESLTGNKHFNSNFLNNTILYFFLIELLQKSNSDRIKEFEIFDNDNSYIYCHYEGYFKKFTTIDYKPET